LTDFPMPPSRVGHKGNEMDQQDQAGLEAKTAFEPSDLIEYGEAREQTQAGGAPAPVPDGATYNS
jgi:hypothetical protein